MYIPVLHSVFIYRCGKLTPPLILGSTDTRKSLKVSSLHEPPSECSSKRQFPVSLNCSPQEKSTSQPSAASRLRMDPASTAIVHHTGHHGPRPQTARTTPVRQHCLHWPPSLCQRPVCPRSVRPAWAGGWGRRCWMHSAP